MPGRNGAGVRQELCWPAAHRRDGAAGAAARQEIDYSRRGKGYVFGAFQPASGAAFTWTAPRRTTTNFAAFLEQTDAWIEPAVARVYAILDQLNAHRATDVLPFALAHPRWEFVFQPNYVAYLNLIEPWWKILRSLALKGRRVETWEELCAAVEAGHRLLERPWPSLHLGPPTRHRPRCQQGIALVPSVV